MDDLHLGLTDPRGRVADDAVVPGEAKLGLETPWGFLAFGSADDVESGFHLDPSTPTTSKCVSTERHLHLQTTAQRDRMVNEEALLEFELAADRELEADLVHVQPTSVFVDPRQERHERADVERPAEFLDRLADHQVGFVREGVVATEAARRDYLEVQRLESHRDSRCGNRAWSHEARELFGRETRDLRADFGGLEGVPRRGLFGHFGLGRLLGFSGPASARPEEHEKDDCENRQGECRLDSGRF